MKGKLLKAMLLSMLLTCTPAVYAEETVVSETAQDVQTQNDNTQETKETQEEQSEEGIKPRIEEDNHAEFEIPIVEGNEEELESSDNENTVPTVDDNTVILTLDVAKAQIGSEVVNLPAPPTVIDNVTLLPLRFIGESVIGAEPIWDATTKTVTITKGETTLIVTMGSKIATVNGMEVELAAAPQIINNSTLLPLRFIGETFGVQIDYDQATKMITIVKPEEVAPVPNNAPVASFYFPDTYIAGQTVTAIDTSFDLDGDAIVEKLWSVEGPTRVTNKDLSKMFKTPRAGTYTIGLQVKDAKGTWSDWTYVTVTINPNEAPTVTSLLPSKSSYAQGEALKFSYTYDNEEWETVKEGKWTYRAVGDAVNRATVGKPEAIFSEGNYIITLYLDDAYGNRSKAYETTIEITDEVVMSELEYRFTKGKIGDWIDNFDNFNYLSFDIAQINSVTYDKGTLVMSDSPEMVVGDGILYRDMINGSGRLLIHHINNITDTNRQMLAVAMENPTDKAVQVTLKNKSIKGPSTDILRVGQLSLRDYLQGVPAEVITLAPGERKFIYTQEWTYNACISGHVDVETTGDVKFTIASMLKGDTVDKLDSMIYYPADGAHYSGTYDKLGIHYNVVLDGTQPQRITLGIANSGEWAVGYDERTMTLVENTGNYGITYYVTVTANEDMGVILNNRGGIFQGAIKWQGEGVYNMPGNGSFNGTTTKAVVMGTIKKGETKTFEYLLPNGSATPTLIGFIPKSQW